MNIFMSINNLIGACYLHTLPFLIDNELQLKCVPYNFL